ncbi:hypothetical protein [Morganella morganii]|uniref:hypothetical protein n=1 Tax=Morganella morganii TaxID=582 RepID=UPI003EBFBABA
MISEQCSNLFMPPGMEGGTRSAFKITDLQSVGKVGGFVGRHETRASPSDMQFSIPQDLQRLKCRMVGDKRRNFVLSDGSV